MRNNIKKAVVYIITGAIIFIASLIGGVFLFLSGKFLPVYVGGTYVIGNQILRYILYVVLLVGIILSAKLADYGISYLIKRFHKKLKRR